MNIMDRERTLFVEITPAIRRRLEATVDNIIALLNELDGDADSEISACENNGGWECGWGYSQEYWTRGYAANDDCEDSHDQEGLPEEEYGEGDPSEEDDDQCDYEDDDREWDPAESGVADMDGLREIYGIVL